MKVIALEESFWYDKLATEGSTVSHVRVKSAVAAEVGRDLPGGLLVAAGQQEVLTAGREVRRENAADVAGADYGHRAIRNSHLGFTFRDVISALEVDLA